MMSMMRILCFTLLGLLTAQLSFAQTTIAGTVTGDGEPLIGANVILDGTFINTTTSQDGSFELQLAASQTETYQLMIKYIGYEPKMMKIEGSGESIDLGTIDLLTASYTTDELTVVGTRLDIDAPFAFTNMSKEDIEERNIGVDMPYIMEMTPSAVVTSDAGAGVGYTGIRIRGSDPTRINVTINGIPLNDSESQGTFWVNMPDFASSVDNIQIQRGAGTSTNGAGAFGATVNLQTNSLTIAPYAQLSNSFGSFNTRRHSLQFGSGLLGKHWVFDGRLSHIKSDGYVDRARSNLRSYYFSGAYTSASTLIRANVFAGHETTYQAWGGLPYQYSQDMGRGAFFFGGDDTDTLRTFNPYTYQDEVDNYQQAHYQLHLNQRITSNLSLNASLHYTKGKGYFEQYRSDDDLASYGLDDVTLGDTTVTTTDLVRRRWLDNDFYGIVYGLHYRGNKWTATLGGGWNRYIGDHFGEIIWAQYASNSAIYDRYYDNVGEKLDGNTYLKFQMHVTDGLNVFADVQHRMVNYSFLGNDRDSDNNITQLQLDTTLHFINPKVGLSYQINSEHRAYASFAVANREPNRNDYTESISGEFPSPETLYDVEAGYHFTSSKYWAAANLYYMNYKNQLILTGQLNDVGAAIRANVPNSYRAGVELQFGLEPVRGLKWEANATFSQNKIQTFTEYVDNWDTWGQDAVVHENTDIAFSPNVIAGSQLSYDIFDNSFVGEGSHALQVAWLSKYVGKQYIDNTQTDSRSLPAYWTNDLRINYNIKSVFFQEASLTFMVKNFLNARYSANAWVYRFQSPSYDPTPDDPYTSVDTGSFYNMIGLYPQAGAHFWIGLDLKF